MLRRAVASVSDRQRGTKGRDHVCGGGNNSIAVILTVGIAHIAPDAEHSTVGGKVTGALEVIVGKAGGLGNTALPTAVAQHPIIVTMGVDHLMALLADGSGRSQVIASPARGPIADLDGLVDAVRGVILIIDAVVEGAGGHALVDNDLGGGVQIVHKALVFASGIQALKAHGGRQIIGILIRADIEEVAALTFKVIGILLHNGQGKGHSLRILQIDGALGTTVTEIRELLQLQNGAHVARGVDAGHDLNVVLLGVIDDGIHVILPQIVAAAVGTLAAIGIAVTERIAQIIGAVRGRDGHVIQGKAEALVVRQVQLQLVIAGISHGVNDGLDALHAEVLAAGIQMDDLIEIIAAGIAGIFRCLHRQHRFQLSFQLFGSSLGGSLFRGLLCGSFFLGSLGKSQFRSLGIGLLLGDLLRRLLTGNGAKDVTKGLADFINYAFLFLTFTGSSFTGLTSASFAGLASASLASLAGASFAGLTSASFAGLAGAYLASLAGASLAGAGFAGLAGASLAGAGLGASLTSAGLGASLTSAGLGASFISAGLGASLAGVILLIPSGIIRGIGRFILGRGLLFLHGGAGLADLIRQCRHGQQAQDHAKDQQQGQALFQSVSSHSIEPPRFFLVYLIYMQMQIIFTWICRLRESTGPTWPALLSPDVSFLPPSGTDMWGCPPHCPFPPWPWRHRRGTLPGWRSPGKHWTPPVLR